MGNTNFIEVKAEHAYEPYVYADYNKIVGNFSLTVEDRTVVLKREDADELGRFLLFYDNEEKEADRG